MNDIFGTIQMTRDDIKFFKDFFGSKTINEIRREVGQSEIVGGEKVYFDFLMENSEITPPKLTVVTNPFKS